MSKRETDEVTGVETTGHEWDGIRELDNPLPRWWLYVFYACIGVAVVYWVLMPAWPGVHGYTKGLLGQSDRADLVGDLADLKTRLQITPAQESAWTEFANTVQSHKRTQGMNRQDMAQLTTPERIDRMRALRAERAAEADRHGDATKALYAALTPAQQKTMDEQTLRHHRKGNRMGEGRHMGRGDHGGMHHHGMHRM